MTRRSDSFCAVLAVLYPLDCPTGGLVEILGGPEVYSGRALVSGPLLRTHTTQYPSIWREEILSVCIPYSTSRRYVFRRHFAYRECDCSLVWNISSLGVISVGFTCTLFSVFLYCMFDRPYSIYCTQLLEKIGSSAFSTSVPVIARGGDMVQMGCVASLRGEQCHLRGFRP